MSCSSRRRLWVSLASITPSADTDGGYTEPTTPLSPATERVAIQSATPNNMESFVANTITAKATHIVDMRYRSDVTTKCRITYGSRVFAVRGVQNVDEKNRDLLVACEEVIA